MIMVRVLKQLETRDDILSAIWKLVGHTTEQPGGVWITLDSTDFQCVIRLMVVNMYTIYLSQVIGRTF